MYMHVNKTHWPATSLLYCIKTKPLRIADYVETDFTYLPGDQ